jgi:transposase
MAPTTMRAGYSESSNTRLRHYGTRLPGSARHLHRRRLRRRSRPVGKSSPLCGRVWETSRAAEDAVREAFRLAALRWDMIAGMQTRRSGPRDCTGSGRSPHLAMTCWLAGKDRFSSSRKAVRFAGLDAGATPSPADLGKAGCSWPRRRPPRLITPHRKASNPGL